MPIEVSGFEKIFRHTFQLKANLPVMFTRRTAALGFLLCLVKTKDLDIKEMLEEGKFIRVNVNPGYLQMLNLQN